MMIFQDSGVSGDKVQDEKTTTQHIVSCIIMVDTIVQKKTPSWLLNFILYIRRDVSIINW